MRSRAIAVAATALLSLTVSGCSPDDAAPAPNEPATPSSESTAPTESTETPSPSQTGVPPAAGQALDLEGSFTFRLPEGGDEWHERGTGSMTIVAGHPVPEGSFDISASEISITVTELDSLAEASLKTRVRQAELTPGRFDPLPTRSPNRVVNGREGWVLESAGKESTFYEFGTSNGGLTATITFQYPTSYAPGREWVEAVLASIEWK